MSAMRCYYEVLGVERTADEDTLKKAYRRACLREHPDKNPHRQAEAEEAFKEIQQAYETLSDKQERAWYDAHRESILRGESRHDGGGGGNGGAEDTAAFERMASGGVNLWSFFRSSAFSGFGATEERSFFNVFGKMFDALSRHDCGQPSPAFGGPKADYQKTVRAFYEHWSNFQSQQDFAWFDIYRLSDAPDRRVRRLMEKDNKKRRDNGKREFNELVRNLVAAVKRRDPRVAAAALAKKAAEEKKLEQQAARQQEAKQRRVNNEKKFTQAAGPVDEQYEAMFRDMINENDGNDDVKQIFECVACGKDFKSRNAFESHEKSKKHIAAAAKLRAEMLAEEGEFEEGEVEEEDGEIEEEIEEEVEEEAEVELDEEDEEEQQEDEEEEEEEEEEEGGEEEEEEEEDEEEEDDHNDDDVDDVDDDNDDVDDDDEAIAPLPTMMTRAERRKLERLEAAEASSSNDSRKPRRRAANGAKLKVDQSAKAGEAKVDKSVLAEEATQGKFRCGICLNVFQSKNQLFKHIKEKGHAMYK
jgi:DnaJ family protein A protein 5